MSHKRHFFDLKLNTFILSVVFLLLALILISCANRNLKPLSKGDVYVSIGEPRHWTLDDAHYLLAGMHERAREVKISKFGDTALDPNSFNSQNVEQIRSVIKASIAVDELTGKKNEREIRKYEQAIADAEQARLDEKTAIAKRDALREQILSLKLQEATKQSEIEIENSKHTLLQGEKRTLEARKNQIDPESGDREQQKRNIDEQISVKDQQIAEITQVKAAKQSEKANLTTQLAAINAQLGFVNTDISNAQQKQSVGDVTPTAVQPPATNQISTAFGDSIANALLASEKFTEGLVPSYNVSDQIANYVNAENELLARQLTLLRDEVGSDKNIVFLELPHSIHSAAPLSKTRRVQLKWEITGYCTNDPHKEVENVVSGFNRKIEKQSPQDDSIESLLQGFDKTLNQTDRFRGDKTFRLGQVVTTDNNEENLQNLRESVADFKSKEKRKILNPQEYIKAACTKEQKISNENAWHPVAWDLIPKADAYNIADYNIRDNEVNLAFIFSRLIGFGANGRFDRRKQQFQQFASQDVFASGYGQGEKTFGWVLSPKPGTSRIQSGAKTTFAAVTVVRDTSVLNLRAHYCVMKESDLISLDVSSASGRSCEIVKEFKIPVQKNKEFWVERINYTEVPAGEAAEVVVTGHGFSLFQLSVLVNGHALQRFSGKAGGNRSVSIDPAANKAIGTYEVTSTNEVLLNFKVPAAFVGTPSITFVTPTKTMTLNHLDLMLEPLGKIAKLSDNERPMFHKATLRASQSKVRSQTIDVSGQGFTGNIEVTVIDKEGKLLDPTPTQTKTPASGLFSYKVIHDNLLRVYVGDITPGAWDIHVTKKLTSHSISEVINATASFNIVSIEVLKSALRSDGKTEMSLRIQGNGFEKNMQVLDAFNGYVSLLPAGGNVHFVSNSEIYTQIETSENKVLFVLKKGQEEAIYLFDIPDTS